MTFKVVYIVEEKIKLRLKMMEKDKTIILFEEEFKKLMIDDLENTHLPLFFPNFNSGAYEFIKELEETFYFPSEIYHNDFQIWIKSFMWIKVGEMKSKQDGLKSTAIYFMQQLMPETQSVLVLLRKDKKLDNRLKYLYEKYKDAKITEPNMGPHKNYMKKLRNKNKGNNKRNPIDSKLRHECFKRDGYKCVECGATNKEKILHCDHIIPVSQRGSDELDNLQTLCDDCNLAKSDKKWKGGEDEKRID